MAWAEITQEQYDRRQLRYASDCTDEERALIMPFMPAPNKVGRPRKWRMREIWNPIQYIAAAGCQWAMLPKEFPPFTTVQHYFYRLGDSGRFDIINDTNGLGLACFSRSVGKDIESDGKAVKKTAKDVKKKL